MSSCVVSSIFDSTIRPDFLRSPNGFLMAHALHSWIFIPCMDVHDLDKSWFLRSYETFVFEIQFGWKDAHGCIHSLSYKICQAGQIIVDP